MASDKAKSKLKEEPSNSWKATDYLEKWNPNAYLNFFCNMNENHSSRPLFDFVISNVIKILNTVYNKKEHIVLEFGGGPCLWSSFLLAQYFDKIWFCDYAPSNLKSIQDWLDEKSNAFNWKPFFNYVLDIKQGHHDNEIEYETKLRSTLKNGKIFRCDVNNENSLFIDCSDNGQNHQQFDMIFSSFCLESACLSYDIFQRTISRFSNILKSGGLLLMCSFRNSTQYTFCGDTFTDLPLNEEIIRTVFIETGYLTEPIYTILDIKPDPIHYTTTDGVMIYYSFKK